MREPGIEVSGMLNKGFEQHCQTRASRGRVQQKVREAESRIALRGFKESLALHCI